MLPRDEDAEALKRDVSAFLADELKKFEQKTGCHPSDIYVHIRRERFDHDARAEYRLQGVEVEFRP